MCVSHHHLQVALDRLAVEAEAAIAEGYSFVVLSDKGQGPERVPVSTLLATGRVHHHLVDQRVRSKCVGPACKHHHHHHFHWCSNLCHPTSQ